VSRELWKRTHRSIAAGVGETRVPVSGRSRSDVPDIQHPRLGIEVKHRRTLLAWLRMPRPKKKYPAPG
jgi:hypothetical protein